MVKCISAHINKTYSKEIIRIKSKKGKAMRKYKKLKKESEDREI